MSHPSVASSFALALSWAIPSACLASRATIVLVVWPLYVGVAVAVWSPYVLAQFPPARVVLS
jgi:hypothetical protein